MFIIMNKKIIPQLKMHIMLNLIFIVIKKHSNNNIVYNEYHLIYFIIY